MIISPNIISPFRKQIIESGPDYPLTVDYLGDTYYYVLTITLTTSPGFLALSLKDGNDAACVGNRPSLPSPYGTDVDNPAFVGVVDSPIHLYSRTATIKEIGLYGSGPGFDLADVAGYSLGKIRGGAGNLITGDINNLNNPADIDIQGDNTVSGNIALPRIVYPVMVITGNNTITFDGTMGFGIPIFQAWEIDGDGLTTDMIDNIIKAIANNVPPLTKFPPTTLTIKSSIGGRSANSFTEFAALATAGYVLDIPLA